MKPMLALVFIIVSVVGSIADERRDAVKNGATLHTHGMWGTYDGSTHETKSP